MRQKPVGKAKVYYDSGFLEKQLAYYSSLPEKQKRHFLAMEYERLGYGSKRYLSRVFECDRQTIKKGLLELSSMGYKAEMSPFYQKMGRFLRSTIMI